MTLEQALVATLDPETKRFSDDFTPQQVIDSTSAASGSEAAAAASAQGASNALAAMTATIEGYQSHLDTKQDASAAGQPNGYAPLDAGGKVPVTFLPAALMQYKGTWSALLNTPTLTDATGAAGNVYVVTAAGNRNLGSGDIEFAPGDWVIHNGIIWEKADNTDAVSSVAGKKGAVVVTKTDVGLDQADNTSDLNKPISTAQQAAFNTMVVSGAVNGDGNLVLSTQNGGTLVAGSVKGPKGDTGSQGVQGIQGIQGIQGVPGGTGGAGPGNVLQPGTITKIAPGGTPTVTINGSSPSQSIDFGLVTGDTGAQGPKGDTGDLSPAIANASVSGTYALGGATGPQGYRLVVGGTLTLTLPTPTNTNAQWTVTVRLTQNATGYAVTLPTGVKWPYGMKPTISTAPNAVDIVNFFWDGNAWYGTVMGQAFA